MPGSSDLDCVVTTVIRQNLSNKETNPILTDPTTKQRTPIQSEFVSENSKLEFLHVQNFQCNISTVKIYKSEFEKLHKNSSKTHVAIFAKVKICNAIFDQSIFAGTSGKFRRGCHTSERETLCGDNVWATVWLHVF